MPRHKWFWFWHFYSSVISDRSHWASLSHWKCKIINTNAKSLITLICMCISLCILVWLQIGNPPSFQVLGWQVHALKHKLFMIFCGASHWTPALAYRKQEFYHCVTSLLKVLLYLCMCIYPCIFFPVHVYVCLCLLKNVNEFEDRRQNQKTIKGVIPQILSTIFIHILIWFLGGIFFPCPGSPKEIWTSCSELSGNCLFPCLKCTP